MTNLVSFSRLRGPSSLVAGLVACSALLLASCSSVHADGMVEQPPGAKPGIRSTHESVVGSKAPPVQRAGRRGNTTPISPFELAKYQYCGSDADCVGEINGCCDCANGGEEVAINKERIAAFRANFECLHVACGDKAPETPCFSGVVSCVNHRCKYFSQEEFEK